MAAFHEQFPDHGLLLVVDELLDYLRTRWLEHSSSGGDAAPDGELRWLSAVRAGGRVEEPAASAVTLRDLSGLLDHVAPDAAPLAGTYTFVAYPSPHLYDGRGANEPWLREVPDQVTKIVWNGWIDIHPDAARTLGVAEGDMVDVESPHGRLQATAHLSREVRADVVAMPIGFGRTSALRYAGGRGANAAPASDASVYSSLCR